MIKLIYLLSLILTSIYFIYFKLYLFSLILNKKFIYKYSYLKYCKYTR